MKLTRGLRVAEVDRAARDGEDVALSPACRMEVKSVNRTRRVERRRRRGWNA